MYLPETAANKNEKAILDREQCRWKLSSTVIGCEYRAPHTRAVNVAGDSGSAPYGAAASSAR